MSDRRHIPSVDRAVRALADLPLSRPVVVQIARQVLAAVRQKGGMEEAAAIALIRAEAERVLGSRIRPVINGTGVILHTNLGRAPLGKNAVAAVCRAAGAYCTLEYDAESGDRGQRGAYAEALLATLCEAEAATVVNNCAAALVLMLRHFTRGPRKEVIVSRGELVQIGGGFRVPDILESSGATLREVGTTNRTVLQDYAAAIGDHTAMLLKVHRSNFWMDGFVESPSTESLATLARERQIVCAEDLGSGASALTNGAGTTLPHEPTPAEVLGCGVDLVCFSGDKLFGGPQAGIIAGKASQIAKLKAEPFFRALRCDKMVLAAVEAAAEAHLAEAAHELPAVEMLRTPQSEIQLRAERLQRALRDHGIACSVVESVARVGGGSLPRAEIPSAAIRLEIPFPAGVESAARQLRMATPSVVGYIERGSLHFDLRTVFPDQEPALREALTRLGAGG